MTRSKKSFLLFLSLSCSFLMCDINAQEQDMVLVSSDAFAMSISPTASELLPEALEIIQHTMNSALQITQGENAGNTTVNYLVNTTKVVFRSTDFHPDNATTTVRFFALTTALTVTVPAGTSFRDYRLRSAESRQSELNDLVYIVFNSTDGLFGSIGDTSFSALNESLGVSLTASDQIVAIEKIYVFPIADAADAPSALNEENLQLSKGLSSIDIVLICVSTLILSLVIVAAFHYRRDSEVSADQSSQGTDGLMVDTLGSTQKKQGMSHTESFDGRLPLYRDYGEFKSNDSASIAILFSDFRPPSKERFVLPQSQVFGTDFKSIHRNEPTSLQSEVDAYTDENEETSTDSTFLAAGLEDSDDMGKSSIQLAEYEVSIDDVEELDQTSESPTETSNSVIRDETSLLFSSGTHRDASSPLLNRDELVPSSFSVLVDSLLMSDPQGLLFASEAKGTLDCNDELSAAETFNIKVFHDDVSSATSNGGKVFREIRRSVSNGSVDVFKVDVEASSQEGKCAAFSDWMKSICVVRSNSASTDSKTSVNTSFSSVTTPSSAEHVVESSVSGPKRKRHRYIETHGLEYETDLDEV